MLFYCKLRNKEGCIKSYFYIIEYKLNKSKRGILSYCKFRNKGGCIIAYFYIVEYSYKEENYLRPKKKVCVFTVTRPTLIFASNPMHFYTEFG